MKHAVLAFIVVLSGCYNSGGHGQDGWDDEDVGESEHDVVWDEHDIRPDFSPDNPPCGNGIVDPGEECDDGNLSNNDACLNSCMAATCGDGYLWLDVEECDDGNEVDNDGCTNLCRLRTCGDGIVQAGEECDDGDDNSDTDPDACRTDCSPARCGDGVADSTEECDGIDFRDETCETLGYVSGSLFCDNLCRFNISGCPVCGNGICDLGEDQAFCPLDCFGDCGNGSCDDAEDQFTCPADCGAVGISAGCDYRPDSCVVLADRTVRCWGGAYGAAPVAVVGLTDVLSLDASPFGGSGNTSCALLAGGTVVCWEDGVGGVPATVEGLSDVVSFDRSCCHGCAVVRGGTVQCWGSNQRGQLGNGTSACEWTYDPGTVSGMTDAVSVATGGGWYHENSWGHSCALRGDGTIRCWGANNEGQLGTTTTESDVCLTCPNDMIPNEVPCSVVPIEVQDIVGALAVAANGDYTCAIPGDGTVKCWGEGYGSVPIALPGIAGTRSISVGGGHGCGLLSDGTVKCWGDNSTGELGDGTTTDSSFAVQVLGLTGAMAVSAGAGHTCALFSEGTAMCWGSNGDGELGDGTTTDSTVPVQVAAW
jgi:cysteine-rich repeat protein